MCLLSLLALDTARLAASQVVYDRLGRQQALTLLRQHLTANLVRLRRRWCAQSRGIAQGSTLSTLLCRWVGRWEGRGCRTAAS